MSQDLRERILEGDRIQAERSYEDQVLAELPGMRAQAAREDRMALAEHDLAYREQRAAQTVQDTQPGIDRWRSEFITWASKGWSLTQRLADLERPLLEDLANLAAAAASSVGAGMQNQTDYGEAIAIATARDAAVDAALARVGALDKNLWPLPEVRGNEFAENLKGLILRYARYVYKPADRGVQFKRGGHGAR